MTKSLVRTGLKLNVNEIIPWENHRLAIWYVVGQTLGVNKTDVLIKSFSADLIDYLLLTKERNIIIENIV